MFRRTYSPLPAWPILGAATCLGVLVSGYVVGPVVARVLMALDNNLFEFPDEGEDA
jgi:hypothetical protein